MPALPKRLLLLGAASAVLLATPAGAQSGIDGRVGKLESEMRAVQRKVFPGGAALEPQITAPAVTAPAPGTPASGAITDLTQRVASLEGQMATLTGQIEQNQYRLRQLEDQFAAYRTATDARLADRTTATPPASAAEPETPVVSAAPRGGSTRPGATAPAASPAPSGRAAAVEKPSTSDAAEDTYMYGYRLWSAKLYPEAQEQLKTVVQKWPKHRRASYAQNLLGRAYLDEGKPSLASIAFYDNYKKMPDGERAPDSLFYLASALVQLKKPADACKVYGELTDVYAGKISTQMKADITKGRTAAKCS